MKQKSYVRVLVIPVIVVGALLLWQGKVVRAQQDTASEIQRALAEGGVPVEGVSITSDVLGLGDWGVHVVLRVPSTRQGSPEIPEYIQQVVAEVTKASVTGEAPKLQAYEVRIWDESDQLVYVEKNTVDASEILSTQEPSLESQKVAALLRDEFGDQIEIESLEVVPARKGAGQRLELLVQVTSVSEANTLIQGLELRRQIEERAQAVNERGAMITECHFRLEDLDGNPVLNLVVDLQDRRWDWWMAEGMEPLPEFPGPPSMPDRGNGNTGSPQ